MHPTAATTSARSDAPPERLHTRIVTVFTLIALAPLVLGAFLSLAVGIWVSRSETAAAQRQTAQLIGNLMSERWGAVIESRRNAAALLSAVESDQRPTLELLRQTCSVCQTIVLVSRSGQIVEQAGAPAPADLLTPALLARVGAGEEIISAAPAFGQLGTSLLLASPIRVGQQAPRGGLVSVIDLQALGTQALQALATGGRGYAYIVDARGRLIVAPPAAVSTLGSDISAIPLVAAALSRQPWAPPKSQVYTGLLSQRVDGAWAAMPGTGWFVLIEVPISVVNTNNWYFIGVQAVLLLITALATVLLGRRLAATITRPIEQLQRGVSRLRAGDWRQPLAVGRRDELGQLAEAFNAMANDLDAQRGELRRRDADLTQANGELQQALAEAHQASMLKSQFIATVSHELRTPLTGVLGYSDMLALGIYGDLAHDQREAIQRIYNNGQHLLELINDLLDFSKLEAGKLDLRAEVFDLRELVGDAVETCLPQAQAKRLPIELSTDPALPARLWGDPLRLRQILLNLLSNAVKFTERGQVSVRISLADRQAAAGAAALVWLLVEVDDTGIGIAPDDQELIFDAFRQIDGGYTRQSGGTGLGLAITRRLVELMGGSIALRSTPGAGSRFSAILPLRPAEAPAADN